MASPSGSSGDRAYAHRRRPTPTEGPTTNPGPPSPTTSSEDGGVQFVCRRFECASQPPFELKGSQLDGPVCPHCKKGDKLEELNGGDGTSEKPYGLGRIIGIGIGVVLLLAGLVWGALHFLPLPGGGGGVIVLLREKIDFGQSPLNVSKTESLGVKNDGTEELVIASISVPAEESFSVQPAALIIPPGGSAEATVTFTPKSPGTASTVLTLESNAQNHPSVEILLSGTGEGTDPEPGPGGDDINLFDELDKTSKILKGKN